MSPPGQSSLSFKGPGSSDNFLRSVRNISGLQDDGGSLDVIANLYDPDALQSRRTFRQDKARLPPLDVARRLFAVQYTYIGTIFSFTDPEAFEQSLLEAYQGLPESADSESRLAYAKVLMILAFGKLYSINQWIDFKGPPGFDYFTAAVDLLPDVHEQGSILYAETLAYVGYFMQNMNRRDAAFLYIGMALRMAISLGLHQEVAGANLDETALEHRRRVWWSIYSLDRIVSVKSGNPLTIQDEDIGISMPSKLPSEPDYCPAVVLRHYTELSRILGEVLTCIYRKTPKSGSRLMASVRNIIMSLNKWYRELPDGLRFDPTKLSASRESVSTFLHYYQCINMTARPLLFHVVHRRLKHYHGVAAKEQDWKLGLSQTTISVIEMCISAAHDTINMMTIAAQLDLVATYGYMDGEHAFSATIVLVVVCGAFPTDYGTSKAMNAGLDLLRGMSQRGNSHMGARYELLAHLKSILMPDTDPLATAGSSLPTQPTVNMSAYNVGEPQPTKHTTDRGGQSQGTMMFGHIPNVGAANLGFSSTPDFSPDADIMANHTFTDGLYDVNADFGSCVGGGDDLMLWEEGFADPAGVDLTQWTQATEMAVDWGNL
ncbi:Transcriptional activator [Didymella keratinophila]|nr:Transcriptional activator [Didymella keratinophila]